MTIRTKLCDTLGIEYPIIQGGMAWVATAELAAAVSEAGGLGVIGAGSAPPEVVRNEVRKARALTSKPFGVNVYFMSPFAAEVIEVLTEEKVPVVTTGAGNPGKYIPRLKDAGTKVLSLVASVNLAKRLERAGVDALVAEGMECGGHIGDIATMPLVPQIVDAVEIPVIAAGGFFDGRGLVAALALGASGIQMGTRFICAAECTVHENYKQAVIKARDRDTVVTGRTTGHPVRVLDNKLAREFLALEARCAGAEEIEALGAGRLRAAVVDGDVQYGSLMAGQIAAMVTRVEPAREIIRHIMATAEETLRRLDEIKQ
ncbi:MAG: enoyl-[acyl-carrier-protein] reductase FabK [Bacillota bacterium]|jgi:enoyl-[acyl-carrier protein] reductase II|nr:enoyl-[acyl-carrier-protein] reductase FabK [Candidatus Fermentithermobacillaceae bacterium]